MDLDKQRRKEELEANIDFWYGIQEEEKEEKEKRWDTT
jgi:hypothetical protein